MPTAIIITNSSITLSFPGMTKVIKSDDKGRFEKIKELIKNNASDEEFKAILDIGSIIKKHPSGLFDITPEGNCQIDGIDAPSSLSKRIVQFAKEGLPFEPLIKFFKNCLANPDSRARTDLYAFLEHNGHPITSDGCFIAYRAVNKDWKDIHTNTFDNSIGQIITKNREECDPNPNQTCSTGLHVAALEYAQGFKPDDGHLIEVKVNPSDVVAIPTDYNGQKMRVCKFEVIAENFNTLIEKPLYDPENVINEGDWDDEGGTDESDYHSESWKPQEKIEKTPTSSDNWKFQKRDSRGRFIKKS